MSEDNDKEPEGATGEENALAIADGVHAWKTLTKGEGPLWRRFNREENEKASRRRSREGAKSDLDQGALPEGHPFVPSDNPQRFSCPFNAMAHLGEKQNTKNTGSAMERPESLPTPPPTTQEHVTSNTRPDGSQYTNLSPPASNQSSVSKCPIRMLDERSPEEIAEYFETHKHEIPRSHEICVKRYQSNAASIRQLDAKYGSLVNMIQGLGMKHQPLLPARGDEEDFAEMDAKSARKVEEWAGNVKEAPNAQDSASQSIPNDSGSNTEERQGHFDRPLKEIRVGESPSRPWGISVPAAAIRDPNEREATPKPKAAASQTSAQPQTKKAIKEEPDDKPRMVFTGPVFIGYSAEEAANLIRKCGWDPQGPPMTDD